MIRNLEDLETWQKARLLVASVYELVESFPGSERYILVPQIKRAVVSVPANIAEGFGRHHAQESIQFYRTARGSLYELRSHFYIAFDQGYIKESSFEELRGEFEEVAKMLNGLIRSTKSVRKSAKM